MISDQQIRDAIPKVLKTIDIPELGEKNQGKVRDFYRKNNQRILITTDRQSGFDVNLGFIPYKGAVLNLLSNFWFQKTKDIIDNHLISIPDPNVMVGKNCNGIPIEMIIRGYITGSTNTSIWYSYNKGERNIYGLKFPDGLVKNQKLSHPVITPTSHGGGTDGHDDRMTREEILNSGLVSEDIYRRMEEATYALYARGNELAEKSGLIIPDTKYEFGIFEDNLILMDELHTPDGSRFWIKESYQERFADGEEPDNFDKEFLRLWFVQQIDPYKEKPPPMSEEIILAVAKRYVDVYEKLTNTNFNIFAYPIEQRIRSNLIKANII